MDIRNFFSKSNKANPKDDSDNKITDKSNTNSDKPEAKPSIEKGSIDNKDKPSSSKLVKPKVNKKSEPKTKKTVKEEEEEEYNDNNNEEKEVKTNTTRSGRKRKVTNLIESSDEGVIDDKFEPTIDELKDDDDDDNFIEDEKEIKFKAKNKPKVNTKQTKVKKEDKSIIKPKIDDTINNEVNDDENKPKKKFSFWAHKNAAPSALGSKDVPIGKVDSLLGLTFVLTGQLSSITREDTMDLIKRCGGRVTSAVSSKTTYLIIGDEPGETKVKKALTLKIKTLDEDQLFDFIKSKEDKLSPSINSLDNQNENIINIKEELTIKPIEKKIELKEMGKDNQLWVDKYKPKKLIELIGNKTNLDELLKYLNQWEANPNPNDKRQRAVLISGPPGIGKTTSAHLACQQAGFSPIELNASDVRSKNAIDIVLGEMITNHTIGQYFSTNKKKDSNLMNKNKPCLILDEIDGMSGGDRGGVAEIIKFIKKTKIPMICICNDRQSPKVKSLANHCLDLRFRRPTAQQVKPRIMAIAQQENMTLSSNVIEKLVEMSCSDIRQVINLLSTWRLSKDSMSYDQSKHFSKSVQKNMILNPFDIIGKFLNGGSYQSQSLSDRLDLYFHDFSLVPLMVQENYIKCKPVIKNSQKMNEDEIKLQTIEQIALASDCISQADLIETSIQRNQNWELMPVHAAFSCAMPAHYANGTMNGMYQFPSYLGQTSKSNKYQRLLKDIHVHMKTKISGDKIALRLHYFSTLMTKLTQPILVKGIDGISEVIDIMDNYYLDKEDWDGLVDLGVGEFSGDKLMKALPTNVKSNFTRSYNKSQHPTIVRISSIATKTKALMVIPDNDEVVLDDVIEDVEEDEDQDEEDVTNDKFINKKNVAVKRKASTTKKRVSKK